MEQLLTNTNYAIPIEKESWINRIERGCVALETFFPSSHLMVAEADRDDENDKPIKNRQKYLLGRLGRSGRDFGLYNGRPNYMKSDGMGGYLKNDHVGIGGQFYEWGRVVYNLSVSYQAETWEEYERVFVAVGDAVGAYNSSILPRAANQRFGYYQELVSGNLAKLYRQENMRKSTETMMQEGAKLQAYLAVINRQLPSFNSDPLAVRDCPAQPKELGWLNYWSAETCTYLGFPDPERDRDLLVHSYQTPAGAWLVKLCPEPLDLDRLDHVKLFADVYARFPKIGQRVSRMWNKAESSYGNKGNKGLN